MAVRPPIPELLRFLEPFEKDVVALALATRAAVLKEAPAASEATYDAYSAVSTGFSFTGRLKETFCYVAVYSRFVNLGFPRGAELPDPKHLLAGTGNMGRHVRIAAPADLKKPALLRLIRVAIENSRSIAAVNGQKIIPPQSVVRGNYPKKRRPIR